jgi:hypothetical protein
MRVREAETEVTDDLVFLYLLGGRRLFFKDPLGVGSSLIYLDDLLIQKEPVDELLDCDVVVFYLSLTQHLEELGSHLENLDDFPALLCLHILLLFNRWLRCILKIRHGIINKLK